MHCSQYSAVVVIYIYLFVGGYTVKQAIAVNHRVIIVGVQRSAVVRCAEFLLVLR